MELKFGPAGLGPVKTAVETLERYGKLGFKACEIAFTYSVYIKEGEAPVIGKKAKDLGIDLSIHAPYWLNLNSAEKVKREATKSRILQCCKIGELLGAKAVVFHPGYYGKNKDQAYEIIREGVKEIVNEIKKNKWKIKIAPETMGKVNVFGSVEEVSQLVQDTGCSFCIDFAHILAREKKIDFSKVERLFPQDDWHCHFSGIVYGDKGEKHHKTTEREDWLSILKYLPKDKKIRIVNESPAFIEDSVLGLKIAKELNLQ